MNNDGFASLSRFKIDRIPSFDIRYSLFDIRYSLFRSFLSDQTDCPLAGGRALMKLQENIKANRRISNKKYRMMKCGIASL
ncbi:hypothetical protein D1AOALGA4SA_680 [Olavius algarvensis Delta 1 endosymbiont]|nr:hypothetical protein D1AOALGA4SA_680 [Olavius algarvensis Delta 1 endosymbiont]